MDKPFGFLVDLTAVKLDEGISSTWIQAMPFGKWDHPLYGQIEFNSDNGKQYADNINNKVRGQDLNIDYDHKEGDAAGWVKQAEVRSDGVWWNVDWTPTAYQKLKEKAYRYFSPEFQDEWRHPSTGAVHKNVAFGGGITNRPYLKGIVPINLSEFFSEQGPTGNEGGKGMKPEQVKNFASKLGLAEDATEEQVLAQLDTLDIVEVDDNNTPPVPTESEELKAAKEILANAKKLAETNASLAPIVKLYEKQAEQIAEQEKRILASEAATRLTEVDNVVKMLSERASNPSNGGGFAIPIPVRDDIRKLLNEVPKQLSESFTNVITKILDAKLVKLGEVGSARRIDSDGNAEKSAYQEAGERAKKLTESDKTLSYESALNKVFNEDEELYQRYRKDSYVKQGGE